MEQGARSIKLLIVAVLVVISSVIGFVLHKGIVERNKIGQTVEDKTGETLLTVNDRIESFYADINSTLILLANTPTVKNGGNECDIYLKEFIQKYIQYDNFGVADTNGDVICSAVPLEKPINIADRSYFIDAKETLLFSPGSFRINRITEDPTVSFGYPVLDENGKIDKVVFSTIGVKWFEKIIGGDSVFKDMAITVVDKNGVVLTRMPEFEKWVGKSVANSPLFKAVTGKAMGIIETNGIDGINRYYQFLPLHYGTENCAYIIVGAGKNDVIKQVDKVFVRPLGLLAIVFMVICTWGICTRKSQ